jgi:hypothetical protein
MVKFRSAEGQKHKVFSGIWYECGMMLKRRKVTNKKRPLWEHPKEVFRNCSILGIHSLLIQLTHRSNFDPCQLKALLPHKGVSID